MPRVSEAEKRRSHRRILDAAARLMRENGVESTSVSDIMSAAGLTHGGFYRHFSSKDELAAAAFDHAVDVSTAAIETAATPDLRRQAYGDYLRNYLSEHHVAEYGGGCPLAAIGAEAGRQDNALHTSAADAVRRMAVLLDDPLGTRSEGKPERGRAIMALLLGSVTLARLAEKPEEARMAVAAGETALRAILKCWPDADTAGEDEASGGTRTGQL